MGRCSVFWCRRQAVAKVAIHSPSGPTWSRLCPKHLDKAIRLAEKYRLPVIDRR